MQDITGIEERRYVDQNTVTSDRLLSAERAIKKSGINPEILDYIIFAHNFGDVRHYTIHAHTLPSLVSRVKHALGIKNNFCVAYDLIFGCPRWIEGIIQPNAFVKSGIASRYIIIGAETISKGIDVHDKDSMIYADGAGAVII